MTGTRIWPNLPELEERRMQCEAQIDARTLSLAERWNGAAPDSLLEDPVLVNLRRRLATYEADIERMEAHAISAFIGDLAAGTRRAVCKCGWVGSPRPTGGTASSSWAQHVMEAVWGA